MDMPSGNDTVSATHDPFGSLPVARRHSLSLAAFLNRGLRSRARRGGDGLLLGSASRDPSAGLLSAIPFRDPRNGANQWVTRPIAAPAPMLRGAAGALVSPSSTAEDGPARGGMATGLPGHSLRLTEYASS